MRIKERTTPMGVALFFIHIVTVLSYVRARGYNIIPCSYTAAATVLYLLVVDYLEVDDFFSVVGQVGEYSHDLDEGEGVRGDFGGEVVLCRGGTDDGIDERVGGNVADCDLEEHREDEFGGGIGQKFGDNRGRNSCRIDHKRGFILRIKPDDELFNGFLSQIGDIFAQFWLRNNPSRDQFFRLSAIYKPYFY